ncbi:transcriptional regulator with XRE-family HTH domain [Paenibacillus anaericanus]|uniref:helix-turn-helix domain-containing protein n=1 Tax=Paenibacillus anaericanus TaxID=170367 RepID=UPI002782805C|nr:helix-turn-helix transcriptional regulator [Paenibacillus anaericanus]MDQ0091617.1 transcriptional regulator with XRE-family HTH domain [Paenibacillus anaericanus]
MNGNKLGKRIAELRIKRNWGQIDLAQKIGMSTSTVGMWETGKRDPSTEMIGKLATLFCVTVDYLLGKDNAVGNITPPNNDSELDQFIKEIMSAPESDKAELIRFWNFMKQKK